MARVSLDVGPMDESMTMAQAAHKTERSHEENQERAYIAASRRADRSIEARVQSARMASEIHKKRTGKSFRISEEIVMREEMYEEEEDNLPRSYRLLSAHMQTPSADLNNRVEAYLSNKVAMSQMLAMTNDEWRDNEINRLFAASFPNAMPTHSSPPPQQQQQQQHQYHQQQQQSSCQQFPQSISHQPTYRNSPESYSPTSFSPTGYSPTAYSPGTAPMAAPCHTPPLVATISYCPRRVPAKKKSRAATNASGKARRRSTKSPPSDSNKTSSPDVSTTRTPSISSNVSPLTPAGSFSVAESAFTTELPPEARMIIEGMGSDAVLDQTLASQDWMSQPTFFSTDDMTQGAFMDGVQHEFPPDFYGSGTTEPMSSKCAMPSMPDDESWQAFIDESAWATDAQ